MIVMSSNVGWRGFKVIFKPPNESSIILIYMMCLVGVLRMLMIEFLSN